MATIEFDDTILINRLAHIHLLQYFSVSCDAIERIKRKLLFVFNQREKILYKNKILLTK